MMREKMLKIADRLVKRADEYQLPFGDDISGFVQSNGWPISAALREVAYQIRAELEDDGGHDD